MKNLLYSTQGVYGGGNVRIWRKYDIFFGYRTKNVVVVGYFCRNFNQFHRPVRNYTPLQFLPHSSRVDQNTFYLDQLVYRFGEISSATAGLSIDKLRFFSRTVSKVNHFGEGMIQRFSEKFL